MIQAKEGFALGADPPSEVLFPEYWKELDKPFPTGPDAMQILREHADVIRRGLVPGAKETPELKAAMATYTRIAGEAEGKNVRNRLAGTNYSKHPHETVEVPPMDQIVRDPETQQRVIFDAWRRGFRAQ